MITTDWNGGIKVEECNAADIKSIAEIKALKDHPNLLVFPHSFTEYDEGFGEKCICTFDEEERMLHTNNIVGFIGKNKTQLTIRSRFTKNLDEKNDEDFFLHYMLQKVFGVHIFDMKHTTSKEKVFDFSLYLFPHFLKKALRQGVYREYQTRHYNDANVRGTIDVSRHLRTNMPFAGNIAYRTREYLYDNDTIQLIRHTIEHIRCHKLGGNILSCDTETKECVSQITQVTESYQKNQRQSIINRNLKPVRHSLYTEYEPLRKLCLQILRHEHLKYGQKKDEIYGVLFDGAWLWEEYLGIVLKNEYEHCYRKKNSKPIYLFDGKRQQIVPDYISKNKCVVADAKYIPLDRLGSIGCEEKATAIYYKTITYMYRLNSKTGLLLYPLSNHDTDLIMPYKVLDTEGCVIKVGFPVPKDATSFAEFSEIMRVNEGEYIKVCNLYL